MGEIALRGLLNRHNKGLGYALIFFSSVVVFGFASDACADERTGSGTCGNGRVIFLIIAGVVSAVVCVPWIIAYIFDVAFLINIQSLILIFLFALWGCIAGVSTDLYGGPGIQEIALAFGWIGFVLSFVYLYMSLALHGLIKKEAAPAEGKGKEAEEKGKEAEEKGKEAEAPAEPEKKEDAPAAAV